jgi:hypothetical protein
MLCFNQRLRCISKQKAWMHVSCVLPYDRRDHAAQNIDWKKTVNTPSTEILERRKNG